MNRFRPFEHWDREFESHLRYEVLYVILCVCAALYVGSGILVQAGKSRVQFPMCLLYFLIELHYDFGADSASSKNEHQEPSWG
jgi:hypothetical protein